MNLRPKQFILSFFLINVLFAFHNILLSQDSSINKTCMPPSEQELVLLLQEITSLSQRQGLQIGGMVTGAFTKKEQIDCVLWLKEQAKKVIQKADNSVETNDKDYVFIHFILNNLPRGLIGLLLAVILSAAMSSTASELNALASTTAIDLYKRNIKEEKDEAHYVKASKWFTLGWGILAILVACVANLFDNLIQLVNIIGSIFYGNVLGIFLLAFFIKFVKGKAVFIAAIITQLLVIGVFLMDWLPYLWLNLLGCALVMAIAVLIQISQENKLKTISI